MERCIISVQCPSHRKTPPVGVYRRKHVLLLSEAALASTCTLQVREGERERARMCMHLHHAHLDNYFMYSIFFWTANTILHLPCYSYACACIYIMYT